jgi:hypothetical protein
MDASDFMLNFFEQVRRTLQNSAAMKCLLFFTTIYPLFIFNSFLIFTEKQRDQRQEKARKRTHRDTSDSYVQDTPGGTQLYRTYAQRTVTNVFCTVQHPKQARPDT